MGEATCFGLTDWEAIEMRIAAHAARAVREGWKLCRGELINRYSRECCLLGAIVLGEAQTSQDTFEAAADVIGDEEVANALEGGFEGWGHFKKTNARAFAIGERLCRRYGADPLHPHAVDQP